MRLFALRESACGVGCGGIADGTALQGNGKNAEKFITTATRVDNADLVRCLVLKLRQKIRLYGNL